MAQSMAKDLKKLKMSELQHELRLAGLDTWGKKAKLVSRLSNYLFSRAKLGEENAAALATTNNLIPPTEKETPHEEDKEPDNVTSISQRSAKSNCSSTSELEQHRLKAEALRAELEAIELEKKVMQRRQELIQLKNAAITMQESSHDHQQTSAQSSNMSNQHGKTTPLNSDQDETTSQRSSSPQSMLAQDVPNSALEGDSRSAKREPAQRSSTEITELAKAIMASTALGRIPIPEPNIFHGDTLTYQDWKHSFKTLVESKGILEEDKIFYLKKYVGTKARSCVEAFFSMNVRNGFAKAMDALDKRFGDPTVIVEAYKEKLKNWDRIKPSDKEGLRKLSDFINQIEVSMASIDGLKHLDNSSEVIRIAELLPDYIIRGWERKAYKYKNRNKTYPSFKAFAEFLTQETELLNDPHSIPRSNAKPKRDNQRQPARAAASHDVKTAAKQDAKCILCSTEIHDLDACQQFLKMSAAERESFIRGKGICFGCLKKANHISKNCPNRSTCDKCGKRHPTLLHQDNFVRQKRQEKQSIAKKPDDEKLTKENQKSPSSASSLKCMRSTQNISSMIIPVWISDATSSYLVYALIDTQSDTTFITEDVAAKLHCQGDPALLKLSTMTDKEKVITCLKYKGLTVKAYSSTSTVELPVCFTKEHIPMNYDHVPTPETANAWPHLTRIAEKIPPLMNIDVGLLIGYDCPAALAPKDFIRGTGREPYAIETELGWTIVGNTSGSVTEGITHSIVARKVEFGNPNTSSPEPEVVRYVHRIAVKELSPYDAVKCLEADFNHKPPSQHPIAQKDLKFLKLQAEKICQDEDGFYSMPLPFNETPPLQNNRKMAMTRFDQILTKMTRNSAFAKDYTDFMSSILANDEAELVPEEEIQQQKAWYLPHHGVYHPRNPKKLRVVFDCSAQHLGNSLNNYLLTGPDLNNGLIGVLCRFRLENIAVMCDIQRMYHKFRVTPTDRDFLRFLWIDDEHNIKDYRMKVHIFGAASSPNCAKFGLRKIAEDHKMLSPEAASFIQNNFYVDDGLTSVRTTQEAINLLENTRKICAKGNLHVHKIISNDIDVMKSVPQADCLLDSSNMDLSKNTLPIERALGVSWCIESDSFMFRLTLRDRPLTKRGVLATVASVYDPLGFVAPVILEGKRILQQACQDQSTWDDPLLEEHRQNWERWRSTLHELEALRIPRCTKPEEFGEIRKRELHHFADASTTGYGACSYLRTIDVNGKVACSLLLGKSRVVPTKVMTIPRLELQAAVLAANTGKLLREELNDSNMEEFYWSDSQIVLSYIANEARRFHVFVANRIETIKEATLSSQWHYVDSTRNPADHASRGLEAKEIHTSTWLHGPTFLQNESTELSKYTNTFVDIDNNDKEVRNCVSQNIVAMTKSETTTSMLCFFQRFSNLKSLVTGTTCIQQYLRRKQGLKMLDPVQARDRALTSIIKVLQTEIFGSEYIGIQQNHSPKRAGNLSALDPFTDENGVLRVGGRLTNSTTLEYGVKHPVILPRRSPITTLMIKHYHEQTKHQGRGLTISAIRSSGFWIVNCGSAVSAFIRQCVPCRKHRFSASQPKMADLPEQRVDPSPPFSYCGIDCFGPFLATDGRKEQKRYGLLVTCLASRAVHVEMINDMTTDAFINSLRCVIAIRGPIKQIRCDRGSNFLGAHNELSKAFQEVKIEVVKKFLVDNNAEFIFNPPHASNFGGVWERQIRSIRNVLNIVLSHPIKLNSSSIRTAMYEAMAIVNSRPLSPMNLNNPLEPDVITPNLLLTGKSTVVTQPPGKFCSADLYSRKQWRKVQAIANEFWTKWRASYLSSLQERKKWKTKGRNLTTGDIVVLKDTAVSRSQWKLGRITSALADNDGVVRKVKLKVGSSSGGTTELERPSREVVLLLEHKNESE